MNISKLVNHLCFSDVFDSNKNEDGTYNWLKISMIKDLPCAFIDKYFFQMYHFHKLQDNKNLPEFIINKYANYLNWNKLLNTINFSEDTLIKHIDKYDMRVCLRTQKISINFLKKCKDRLTLANLKDLSCNVNISEETLTSFSNLFQNS